MKRNRAKATRLCNTPRWLGCRTYAQRLYLRGGRLSRVKLSAYFYHRFVVSLPIVFLFWWGPVYASVPQKPGVAAHFASLKARLVHTRVGPGFDYRLSWTYKCAGLPVEIIQSYDNWRKIRDPHGDESWVYHSLLTGKRSVIVAVPQGAQNFVALYRNPGDKDALSKVELGVIGAVKKCTGDWCNVRFSEGAGWIKQKFLWGVYPEEVVK